MCGFQERLKKILITDIIKEIEFDHSHIAGGISKITYTFGISELSSKEKKERLDFLQATINTLSKNRSKSIVGDKVEILVEGISSKYENMVTGRTTIIK